jgi:hypothetical protein
MMSEWQSIESAPKDGTGVTLIDMSSNDPTPGAGYWRDGVWSAISPRDDPTNELIHVIVWVNPTHWQPLPPPPSEE